MVIFTDVIVKLRVVTESSQVLGVEKKKPDSVFKKGEMF